MDCHSLIKTKTIRKREKLFAKGPAGIQGWWPGKKHGFLLHLCENVSSFFSQASVRHKGLEVAGTNLSSRGGSHDECVIPSEWG